MNRHIVWKDRALTDLGDIGRQDQRTAQRIADAVNRFAELNTGDVKKMAGGAGEYRLRVGDWRVLFKLEEGGRVLAISRVLNRRDAYR